MKREKPKPEINLRLSKVQRERESEWLEYHAETRAAIGRWLAEAIKASSTNQVLLARKVGIGEVSISNYINGIETPRFDTLWSLAVATGHPFQELVAIMPEPPIPGTGDVAGARGQR